MSLAWPLIHAGSASIESRSLADARQAITQIEKSQSPLVGYFSYDLAPLFESLPTCAVDADLQLPLIAVAPARPDKAAPLPRRGSTSSRIVTSTFDRQAYEQTVQRCIDYIRAGDIFQVNLSQRFTIETDETPAAIWQRLQQQSASRFGAFLDFGDYAILSNSPELFLRVERLPDGRRKITNRPIKGTRPRIDGMEAELRDSEKDKAELAMIVDLQRNDLGRICEIGSVIVTEPRVIESLPTVYHGVATIEGILREGVSLYDTLRATFPCGSVTGCPKIRAMQIIDELEPVRRGPYCGAIGWIDPPSGTMELNVAIRTMVLKGHRAYVAVGGGIVADSVPTHEYDETMVKAQALFRALGVA